ncbi:MAG TPA: Fe2+-dependent dioxygenase [Steroidobacteraceae bacterium]|jgi:PKHD-type hydroxylase
MILTLPQLLTAAQVAEFQKALGGAEWIDGRATAGYLSSRTKNNQQLPEGHPTARRLGDGILDQLDKNPLFISAALPLRILPPLFNRYTSGQAYGGHIDGAVRPVAGTPYRVRTDLSATIFLTDPAEYDGGELMIGEGGEEKPVKLAAGDMVLYGGGTVHRVTPVTRGTRVAAFLWIQSMVRDDTRRSILFELDNSLQQLGRTAADHDSCVRLAGVYHNLLRQWADT